MDRLQANRKSAGRQRRLRGRRRLRDRRLRRRRRLPLLPSIKLIWTNRPARVQCWLEHKWIRGRRRLHSTAGRATSSRNWRRSGNGREGPSKDVITWRSRGWYWWQ
jgi:hypothetical protein